MQLFSRRLPAALATAALLLAFLLFPDTVKSTAREALAAAAGGLVPSLFPYMVVASLAARRSLLAPLGTPLSFLGLPSPEVLALGLAAGFPTGASASASLYREGRIGKREAELLAAASSGPSPAFLVGAVGGMWGDARFGWLLYAASDLTLLLFARAGGHRSEVRQIPVPSRPFSADLADSVSGAGSACLAVTASVVFFRILAAVGGRLLPPLGPLFALFFEFSAGAAAGPSTGGIRGAAMTGAAVGFSGLAVLTQTASCLSPAGLSLKPYLASRCVLSSVLAALSAGYATLFPMTPARTALAPLPDLTTALCFLALSAGCALAGEARKSRAPYCFFPGNLIQ